MWDRLKTAFCGNAPRQAAPGGELIEGIEISMGGRKLVVPPLNLKQIRKYSQVLMELQNLDESNVLARAAALGAVIHAAISRNYPEITLAQVEDMLDLSNLLPAVQALMRVSGLGETGAGSRGPGASSTGS